MAVEAVRRSPWHGSVVGAGALTTDAIYFALTYALRGFVPDDGRVRFAISLAGAFVLLFLAHSTVRNYRSGGSRGAAKGIGQAFPYFMGLALGFTNPWQMAWWLTVGLGMMVHMGLTFAVGFFLGIAAWVVALPLAVGVAHRRRPWVYPLVVLGSSAAMVAFAVWFVVASGVELL